MEPTTYLGRQQ